MQAGSGSHQLTADALLSPLCCTAPCGCSLTFSLLGSGGSPEGKLKLVRLGPCRAVLLSPPNENTELPLETHFFFPTAQQNYVRDI